MRRTDLFKLRGLRRGLTLTEVLVALVLASMVVLGSWRFFGSASVSMQVFNGMVIADERLAFASDIIVNDVRSAGMFGSPHSEMDPLVCPKPLTPFRAITVRDGGSLTSYSFGLNVNVSPDVCIFQTPVTPRFFHPVTISGNVVTLSAGELGMPVTTAEFDTLFLNRVLRITAPNGFSQFTVVTAANFDSRQVTVNPAPVLIENNGVCGVEGIGGPDHEISVLTHARYRIIPDPVDDNSSEDTLLVREELLPDLTSIVPGTRIAIAENVVDLQCWGDRDTGGALGASFATDTALGDDTGSADTSTTSNQTHQMRVFHYRITARTDREFAPYGFIPKADAFDLLTTWDIDGDAESAALAVTVGQQIELSNFVARSLR